MSDNLFLNYNSELLKGKEGLNDFYEKRKENNNEDEEEGGKTISKSSTIDRSERNVKPNFIKKRETKDEA